MTSEVRKGHLKISKSSFSAIYFLLNVQSVKNVSECQRYEDSNFSLNEVWPQGHIRPLYAKIIQSHSFMDWFDESLYEC